MKKHIINFLLACFLFFSSGCIPFETVGPYEPMSIDENKQEECMPLLLPAGYTIGETYYGEPVTDVDLPPRQWVLISSGPKELDKKMPIRSIFKQETGYKLAILLNDKSISIYDTESDKWEFLEYPTSVWHFTPVVNESYFLYDSLINEKGLSFYEFDPTDNSFKEYFLEYEFDIQSIYNVITDGINHWGVFHKKDGGFLVGYFKTQDSKLGEVKFYDLYPDSEEAYGIKFQDYYGPSLSLALDKEGNLYVATVGSPDTNSVLDGVVYKIFKDGEKEFITNFASRQGFNEYPRAFMNILLDTQNRLWLGDYLWVDLSSKVEINGKPYYAGRYIMYRSPVFVTNKPNPAFEVVWNTPQVSTSTPDGRIWYQSLRGTAWFQPETGEWCMFSSSQSNIIKDSDGNLWMVYDNDLYMLPASETSKKE